MIELRTPAQIEEMRPAGRFVASVITALAEKADVGVNLLELDALAHDMIRERGAESCYVDYHPSFGASPFGKVLCTSVNDAVLHGLPHDYVLQDGDLLSVDFAVAVDGWVGDSALSRRRRHPAPGGPRADRDHRARRSTTRSSRPGPATRWATSPPRSARSPAAAGLGVNLQFGGHGVGRTMHGEPHVPNDGRPGRGYKLKPGLVIAIEPWFMHTTDRDLHRPRRLDPAQRRRLARRAHGAHRRHHRRRPAGAHRPRVEPRRSGRLDRDESRSA